jgi:cysteine synthase A/argininosuccinate lyase
VVLGIASKKQVGGSRQVAMEIVYPATIPDEISTRARQVADAVAGVLAAHGATGLTHTELVWSDDGVWLIETANRGGGVNTSATIVPAVSGFDVNGFLLAEAAGDEPIDAFAPVGSACMLRFLSLDRGYVASVDGLDAVRRHPGVIEAGLWVGPGDVIAEIANATNRNGYVIAVGETSAAAQQTASDALTRLRVEILAHEPGPCTSAALEA